MLVKSLLSTTSSRIMQKESAQFCHPLYSCNLGPASLDCSCPALQATELRLAGNAEARGGDLRRAVELYTQVCFVGVHVVSSIYGMLSWGSSSL